jgi:hypothetical protein
MNISIYMLLKKDNKDDDNNSNNKTLCAFLGVFESRIQKENLKKRL